MPVVFQAEEQVLQGVLVARNLGVEADEELETDKEHVGDGRIDDDGHHLVDGLFARVEVGHPLEDQGHDHDQCRTGGKGRGEEARGNDGGQPEMPAGQTAVQHGGDGVDRDGKRNGQVDKEIDPFRRVYLLPLGGEDHPAAQHVEQQIAPEHAHIPEQHGIGCRVKEHVEAAQRLTEVGHDEHHTHQQRGNGEEFPEDRNPPERLIIVNVIGQYEHHPSRRDADQEGELGDVEPPGDIATHAGERQTGEVLPQVADHRDGDKKAEKGKPHPVVVVSF